MFDKQAYCKLKNWNVSRKVLNKLTLVKTTSTQVFKQFSSTYLNNTTLGLDLLAYIQDRKCTLLNVGGL